MLSLIQTCRQFSRQLTDLVRASLNHQQKPDARDCQLHDLEQRVMYSASPLGDVAEPLDAAEFIDGDALTNVDNLDSNSLEAQLDHVESLLEHANREDSLSDNSWDGFVYQADNEKPFELIVVDESVDNIDKLLAGVADQQKNINVIVVGNDQNGFAAVTKALADGNQYSAIHLLAHGNDGALSLGNSTLTAETIDQISADLSEWGNHLTTDADIMVYGCNLAETTVGEELVQQVASLTGADVAASDDLTGHAMLDGDWVLEYSTGRIQSEIIVGSQAQGDWADTLINVAVVSEYGGEVITVTTFNDLVNGDVDTSPALNAIARLKADDGGDGISLREAIIAANNQVGFDAIVLDIGTYLRTEGGFEDLAFLGDLDITDDLAIIGAGLEQTIIDGAGFDRVFEVRNGAEVHISDLTIKGGSSAGRGGGINVVQSGSSLDLERARVFQNQAADDGGGISASSNTDLVIEHTSIFNNVADDAGGGVYVSNATAQISNSTLHTNTADQGGGLGVEGNASDVELVNVTISGNDAWRGGGIYSNQSTSIVNSTIAYNTADHQGGGLYGDKDVEISNSILAHNTASSTADNARGNITSLGFNIDNDGSAELGHTTDLSNVDPVLGALQNNGGYVATHALQAGSVAINAGGSSGLSPSDATGAQRNNIRDIGAFEFRASNDSVAYWADRDSGEIRRGTADGGYQVVLDGLDNPFGVSIDLQDGKLYWTEAGSNEINRANLDGTGIENIISSSSIVSDVAGLVVDTVNDKLYYVDSSYFGSDRLMEYNLATETLVDLGVFDGDQFFDVEIDTTNQKLYWTDGVDDIIYQRDLTTGTNSVLIPSSSANGPISLAIDHTNGFLYWTDNAMSGTDRLMRYDLVGSGGTQILTGFTVSNPIGIAVDQVTGDVYWTEPGNDAIWKWESDSGDVNQSFGSQPYAQGIEVVTLDPVEINQLPEANDENLGELSSQYTTIINVDDLLLNDTDSNADEIRLLDFSQPVHGSLVDNGDGTLTYTPKPGYTGPDSFDYVIDDGQSGLVGYWNLEGGGVDSVGTNDATINGASIADGEPGLHFSQAEQDYVQLGDINYGSDFTISFKFKVDDLDGSDSRYLYSHGDEAGNHSINILFRENSAGTSPGTLGTIIRDGNDAFAMNALNVNAGSLVGGWHTYTLVVKSGAGAMVYIDGMLSAFSSHGADGVNPTGNIVLGSSVNLSSGEFLEGSMDTLRIYDHAQSVDEINFWKTPPVTTVATASFDVNSAPEAGDDSFDIDMNNVFSDSVAGNDSDFDGDSLTYELKDDVPSGTLSFQSDGSFTYTPVNGFFGSVEFTYTVRDVNGATDEATVTLNVQETFSISGTIHEDVDGDGFILDDGAFLAGVDVHLYEDTNSDGQLNSGDTLVVSTSTNASGEYSFSDLDSGQFFVVVDSRSITPSAGLNAGYTIQDVWAQQTMKSNGGEVGGLLPFYSSVFGGRNSGVSDDALDPDNAQHVTAIEIEDKSWHSVDSAYSFNVVTNTLGGDSQDDDGDSLNNRSVQGSLRQFIANANAITGANEMRFTPTESVNTSAGSRSWWRIEVTDAFDAIVDAGTIIDGTAYNPADPTQVLNPNGGRVGVGGNVGVDDFSLGRTDRPELEIINQRNGGASIIDIGLDVQASNVTIQKIAISGFGDSSGTANIRVGTEAGSEFTNVTIADNLIGSKANTRQISEQLNGGSGIIVYQADQGTIHNNIIGFSSDFGVAFFHSAMDWEIRNNEIIQNGLAAGTRDGIDILLGSGDHYIHRNFIFGNRGSGIDSYASSGGNVIENNTISQNGWGDSNTSGIRLMGTDNEVVKNEIEHNRGAGVLVVSKFGGGLSGTPSNQNEISQNYFHDNGGLPIDLIEQGGGNTENRLGDGRTLNNASDAPFSGNFDINYPEFASANLANGLVTVQGTSIPGATVEFYTTSGDGDDIEFLGQTTVDGDGNFSADLSGVNSDDKIVAIAIDVNGNTSEFSDLIEVNAVPVITGIDDYQITDKQTINPFSGVSISDPDPGPSLTITVRISDGDANGIFSANSLLSSGFLKLSAGVYRIQNVSPGTAASALAQLEFVPTENQVRPGNTVSTTFEVAIDDGLAIAYNNATVVEVESANDAPTAIGHLPFEIDEMVDTTGGYNLGALAVLDPDFDDSHTFTIVGGPDQAVFSFDGNQLVIDDGVLDYEDQDVYRVRVAATDANGLSVEKWIEVDINDLNDLPEIENRTPFIQIFDTETALPFEGLSFYDQDDAGSISVVIEMPTGNGEFTSASIIASGFTEVSSGRFELNFVSVNSAKEAIKKLKFVPNEGQVPIGSSVVTEFTVTLSDGTDSVDSTVTLEVLPKNFDPVINSAGNKNVDENFTGTVIDIDASDADDDDLTYHIVGGDDHALFTVDELTGELTFIQPPDFENPLDLDGNNRYRLTVEARDGFGGSVSQDIEIRVLPVNEHAPQRQSGLSVDIDENTTYVMHVNAVDADAPHQTIEYSITGDGDDDGLFSIDSRTGELVFNAPADEDNPLDANGDNEYVVEVSASDGEGKVTTWTIDVTVNSVAEAPVAVNDVINVSEGQGINFLQGVLANDSETDMSTAVVVTGPAHGELNWSSDGTFTYSHDGSETTSDQIVYRVENAAGSSLATVQINIDPVNDRPVFVEDAILLISNNSIIINQSSLLANDIDAENSPLSIIDVVQPPWGTVTNVGSGNIQIVVQNELDGIETIEYTISDGDQTTVGRLKVIQPVVVDNTETESESNTQESESETEAEANTIEPEVTADEEPVDEATIGSVGSENNDDESDDTEDLIGSEQAATTDQGFEDNIESNDSNVQVIDGNLLDGSQISSFNSVSSYSFKSESDYGSSYDISRSVHTVHQLAAASTEYMYAEWQGQFWNEMNEVREQYQRHDLSTTTVATAASVTGVLTVGYVLWLVRGGLVMASLVSSVPMWQSFDPLPILQYAEDDSASGETLESLVDV